MIPRDLWQAAEDASAERDRLEEQAVCAALAEAGDGHGQIQGATCQVDYSSPPPSVQPSQKTT